MTDIFEITAVRVVDPATGEEARQREGLDRWYVESWHDDQTDGNHPTRRRLLCIGDRDKDANDGAAPAQVTGIEFVEGSSRAR